MTIETKIAKNGRINAKVNGKCVAINTLSELVAKSLRNNEQVELIASDGHKFTCTGYDFYEFAHPLCKRYSFNFMDDAGNTFPAYTMTEAIYTVDKFASGEYKTRNIFAEYAVTAEAMDIATEAEIELANSNAETESATENDNEKHNERTYITFSVAPYHCEELKQEHFDDIKAELEEITEGKNVRCDAEFGIAVVVPNGQAKDSVEKILDAYGLNYQRYIFTKHENAEAATVEVSNETAIDANEGNELIDLPEILILKEKRQQHVKELDTLITNKGVCTADEFNTAACELHAKISYIDLRIDAINKGDNFDYRAAEEHIENVYIDLQNFIDYQIHVNGLTQEQCEAIYVALFSDRNFNDELNVELRDKMIENFKAQNLSANNAEVNTATDANEEIINCTDDIIITDDAYTQMIRTELANAQIASGNYGIQINGEWVYFTDHKITRIDAGEFSFEYTLQGRKQFRHNGRVISRDGVIKIVENKETAKAQEKSFREFFINPDAPKHGFFQVQISPTFADSCEHNYTRYFEYYADAINIVNDAIKFCGDVPTYITIKRDKQAGMIYYHRNSDGTVCLDKPDTDFFKNYSADEIKSRIGEIDRAIADNIQFRNENDSPIIGVAILNANDQLAVTRNFYEFVLHENAPVTLAETDGSEEDDDDNEVFNLLPSVDELNDVDLTKSAYFDGRADLGYIFKLSVAINHSFDGTRPWTLESIDGNITVEGRTWQDYAKFIITDTDGSEEDDDVDEMPALYPTDDDSDDDELIDLPATTPADDFEAKLAELKAKQDAAKTAELAAKKVYEEASDKYVECQEATQNFLDAHADKLTEKINTLEIESYITMIRDNGKERYDVFDTSQLNVYAFNGFGEMFLVRYMGNVLGTYDTPAQIEVVINQLKAAIERGDREFTFPTVEELTKPEVDKMATADSLTRAMTIALENYQDFCRVGNLTAATNELSLYNICREAMTELWKGEAA